MASIFVFGMGFIDNIRAFWADEDGSVIIDWTVITAAIVGLSLFMFDGVAAEVEGLARDIEASLINIEIPKSFADYAELR